MAEGFMAASHWPALITTWLLSVYGIYLLMQVVWRIRANDQDVAWGWWLGGALSIGTGIWAESFIGLVALNLPIKVGYVASVVLASWVPAVCLSAAVLWLLARNGVPLLHRVAAQVMFAMGFCMIVLVDAASIVVKPEIQWDWRMVVLGTVIVTCGCLGGSVLVRRQLLQKPNWRRMLMLAVLIGSSIRIGQQFIFEGIQISKAGVCFSLDQLHGETVEWMLTATVVMLFVLMHMGTTLDRRARRKQEQLVQSLRKAQTELETLAYRDTLTGLYNRAGLDQYFAQKPNGNEPSKLITIFRISLDGYRAYVESYGHGFGDHVIRHMSGRLKGLIRDRDVLSRADADEFMLVCEGLSDHLSASQVAQRLSDAIQQRCEIEEVDMTLSCSIGIAQSKDGVTGDTLMQHSMDALQAARKAGGGVHCFYETGMDRKDIEQVEMQRDLRDAIARNELSLHFQPKIRVSGELAGVEALLRWTHPKRGFVSPAQFIPVAERFGLISEMGMWVLSEACRHIRLWMESGREIPVAVNVSVHQLRQPDFSQKVAEVLQRHDVPPHLVILEITESAAMEDIEASIRVFDMLAALGVQLSIDDFGTGYSSLSYLRRLPAKQLKIDRSFVKDLDSSPDAQAIVEAVVRLSHALGMKVVAEGVETQDQATLLSHYACDELQGFLFAKPMPNQVLQTWLNEYKPEPVGHSLFAFSDAAMV